MNLKMCFYLRRWWERETRRRSICKPRSCDVWDWSTCNRSKAFSSAFSQPPRWYPSSGPSAGPRPCRLPSFSTTNEERRTELPATKRVWIYFRILFKTTKKMFRSNECGERISQFSFEFISECFERINEMFLWYSEVTLFCVKVTYIGGWLSSFHR